MTEKTRFITGAAVLVLFVGGAELAIAQSAQQQLPEHNVTAINPMVSRPGNIRVINSAHNVVALPLTASECGGLGGVVAPVLVDVCGTGQKCVVADKDGVIHSACITAAK